MTSIESYMGNKYGYCYDKKIYFKFLGLHLNTFLVQITPPPISKTDFDKVLARQRPTVSKGDLEVHERFTKEFGEEG